MAILHNNASSNVYINRSINVYIQYLRILLNYYYVKYTYWYCLIDLYLVGITFTNKFEYIHPSDEGLIMYHQRPIQANDEFE